MAPKETKAPGRRKYWRTLKLKDGRTIQVAIVRKKKES